MNSVPTSWMQRCVNETDHFDETAHTLASKRGHNLKVDILRIVRHLMYPASDSRNAWILTAPALSEPRLFLPIVR